MQRCQQCTKDERCKLRATRMYSMICCTGQTRIPCIFCGTSNSSITSSATIDMNLIPKQSVKQNVLLTNFNQLQKKQFLSEDKMNCRRVIFSFGFRILKKTSPLLFPFLSSVSCFLCGGKLKKKLMTLAHVLDSLTRAPVGLNVNIMQKESCLGIPVLASCFLE